MSESMDVFKKQRGHVKKTHEFARNLRWTENQNTSKQWFATLSKSEIHSSILITSRLTNRGKRCAALP